MPTPPSTPSSYSGPDDAGSDIASSQAQSGRTSPPLLRSFFMGGFESASHINARGVRIDMVTATQHDRFADLDYQLLTSMDILAARDGFRWHLIETHPGEYDFASIDPMIAASQRHGVQVVWNLLHYGWPDGLDVFSSDFIERFAAFARAAARHIADLTDEPPFYAPVNEISFLAWAIGERACFHPFAPGRAPEAKRQFVRATIAACDAIWDVDLRARFVHTDPIYYVFAPRWGAQFTEAAHLQTQAQYESWDLIAGLAQPQLGGHPCYLDILGVNYYHNNQWEFPETPDHWHIQPPDDRRVPLWTMLKNVHDRYHRPLIMTETSHVGSGRAHWLAQITEQVITARDHHVAIEGLCLYPVIDRPDWVDPAHWHNSGLWDLVPDAHGNLQRVLITDYADQLHTSRRLITHDGPAATPVGSAAPPPQHPAA
jgi:hypothetical protein